MNKPWKVAIDDGLYPNSSLCYGIGAHINDLIVQKILFWLIGPLRIIIIIINNCEIPILMKICPWNFTHIKQKPFKTIFPIKAFQISWSHGSQSCEFKILSIIRLCHDNVDDYEFLRL